MSLDRFDMASIAAAAALFAAAVVVGMNGKGPETLKREQARTARAALDPAISQKLALARAQFESGQVRESAAALSAISAQAPGLAEPHALLGQAYSRLLDYPSAMREFKYALMIDPDYIDSKSPKFIGKRIKAAVRECVPQLKEALARNPNDASAQAAMGDVNYLERMLAGGCD